MKICNTKLANALKYQAKRLSMNDTFNVRNFGTDFFHWSIVRKVRASYNKQITISEVEEWLETV